MNILKFDEANRPIGVNSVNDSIAVKIFPKKLIFIKI
jgi:hypothetical protein